MAALTAHDLHDLVADGATEFGVPGVAVGLWHQGQISYACHGTTSIEHPLPVDRHTLFQAGSIGKTFTAAALVLLEAEGNVVLDAPVRRYVPELKLADASAAAEVTLRQLLNHTAGWDGDFFPDTGEGDDALTRLVARLHELHQLTPPGAVVSYNNAALCLAGRVIEKVTGETYEGAIRRLLLAPLGLRESFFFRDDIMTRRFAVGHTSAADGALRVARPWGLPRSGAPAGGLVTSIVDLLAWARAHLEDDGVRGRPGLGKSSLGVMREPSVRAPGWAFGDAVGIGWILSDLGGAWLCGHDGSTHGQEASLALLPEEDWALAIMTNASPAGLGFNRALRTRVLAACTGWIATQPQTQVATPETLAAYAGTYGARGMRCEVAAGAGGALVFSVYEGTELLELMSDPVALRSSAATTLHADLLRDHADRFVFIGEPVQGIPGYFARARGGAVQAVQLFGRWLPRLHG